MALGKRLMMGEVDERSPRALDHITGMDESSRWGPAARKAKGARGIF